MQGRKTATGQFDYKYAVGNRCLISFIKFHEGSINIVSVSNERGSIFPGFELQVYREFAIGSLIAQLRDAKQKASS